MMRIAIGLAAMAMLAARGGAQSQVQPLGAADWRRAIVNMAADPKFAGYKVRIAGTRDGSTWWLRLTDLAQSYKAGADTLTIVAHVDASRDKSVPWRRREIQFVVRCSDRTYDTPAMIQYAPSGKVIQTDRHATTAETMAPVPSGSMADAVAANLCGGALNEMGEIVPG